MTKFDIIVELQESSLSPRESLDLIAGIINKTKENFKANSFYFLLWGWLISIASISFFLLHQYTGFRYYFLPFPVLSAGGIIISLLWFFKKTAVPETYQVYFFSRLWLVLGISFILVVFISLSQKLLPFTYTLILAGIGTLVSGLNMRFRPLVVGGILFFLAAVSSVYVPDAYKPLLFGAVTVAGYLVPGYLLKFAKD
jgi:hypothetical protein